jgi:hypothetical protein
MSIVFRSLVTAIAAVVFAVEVHGVEPSGSVANIPTPTSPGSPMNSSAGALGDGKPNERLREGTKLVDVTGTFQSAGGDSISFSRDGSKESFRVLENLALQRVGQVLENNPAGRQWIVSGEITEYRSANYLLLKKAVMRLQDGEGAAGQ